MTQTTATKLSALADIFEQAKQAALAADVDTDDGGTCNFDTPAFRVTGVRAATITQAAQEAGLTATPFQWFGGQRWFWLNVPMNGQASRRTRMMEAALKVLKGATIPGLQVCGYYQMD